MIQLSVVVIRIGCLECGNQSDLLGVYPSEAEARAAHPEMRMRAEMSSPRTDMRMTGSGHEWSGDWVEIGFFVRTEGSGTSVDMGDWIRMDFTKPED